jgi:hypothetical protein
MVTMMVEYLYCLDYDADVPGRSFRYVTEATKSTLYASSHKEETGLLKTHAEVHIFADRLGIDGLKELSVHKIKHICRVNRDPWDPIDLLKAADLAYTSMLETDRPLKDAIASAVLARPDLFYKDKGESLLKRVPSLMFDVVMLLTNQHYTAPPSLPTSSNASDAGPSRSSSGLSNGTLTLAATEAMIESYSPYTYIGIQLQKMGLLPPPSQALPGFQSLRAPRR